MTSLVALTVAGSAPARDPCRPAVEVSGDAPYAAAISASLDRRGVSPRATDGCQLIAAFVQQRGDLLHITIVDPSEGTVERDARDTESASTAIESWARRDVDGPLLAIRPEVGPRLQRSDPEAARVLTAPAPGSAAARHPRTIGLHGYIVGGLHNDGSLWRGVGARGCVRIGRMCSGALVQYAVDAREAGDALRAGTFRSIVDFALFAELPIALGRISLAPSVGFGPSALLAESGEGTGEEHEDQAIFFSLRAGIDARLKIAKHWRLGAHLALSTAPWARRELAGGDRNRATDDDGSVRLLLPGTPAAGGWLGLAMGYTGL